MKGYENDLSNLDIMSQFLENQITKVKELVASFARGAFSGYALP